MWWMCVCAAARGEQPHVVLYAEALSAKAVKGEATWTRDVSGSNSGTQDWHFILPLNFKQKPNLHISSWQRAQGFFNAWESASIEIDNIWDCEGHALLWTYEKALPVLQTYSLDRVYVSVQKAPSCVKIAFRTKFTHQQGDCGYWKDQTVCGYGWFPSPRFQEKGVWSDKLVPVEFTYKAQVKVASRVDAVVLGSAVCETSVCEDVSQAPVRALAWVWGLHFKRAFVDVEGVRVSVLNRHHGGFWDAWKKTQHTVLQQASEVLRYYQKILGRYPYPSLIVVETTHTLHPWGGSGVVFLDDASFVYNQSWLAQDVYRPLGNMFLARWIAHQFWGQKTVSDPASSHWVTEGLAWTLALMYGEEILKNHTGYHTQVFSRGVFDGLYGASPPEDWRKHVLKVSYENHVRFKVDEALALPQKELLHVEENTYRQEYKSTLKLLEQVDAWGAERSKEVFKKWYEESQQYSHVDALWFEQQLQKQGVDTFAMLHQADKKNVFETPQVMRTEGKLGGAPWDVHKHMLAWNMLPLEKEYVAGMHVSGKHGVWWDWKLAGGVKDLWFGGEGYKTRVESGVSASFNVPLARKSGVYSAFGYSSVPETPEGAWHRWHVEQGYEHAFFYSSHVGQVGGYQLPRSVLHVGARYDHFLVRGVGKIARFKDVQYYEGPGGVLHVKWTQDETVRLGWKGSLESWVGMRAPWYRFFVGAMLKMDSVYVVPYAGHVKWGVDAGVLTPGMASVDRFEAQRMPGFLQAHRVLPYDAMVSGDVRWEWPLLKAFRLRQELLLNTFVLDDVSVVWHYAVAGGGVFVPPSDVGWWNRTSPTHMEWLNMLGEVGGALNITFGTFAGNIHVRAGAAVSVWPAVLQGSWWPFVRIVWNV